MAPIGKGSVTGPLYSLGNIVVAVPGTPVPLNQNVTTDTGFGTAATPSPMCANQIKFQALKTNAGQTYITLPGGTKATAAGIGIFHTLQPGETFILGLGNISNPYQLKQLQIDADNANDTVHVAVVIV